jgi:hypothetical protein
MNNKPGYSGPCKNPASWLKRGRRPDAEPTRSTSKVHCQITSEVFSACRIEVPVQVGFSADGCVL